MEKSLQATAASGSSGRRDAIEDAGTDRGQRDARRLYPRSTSTSRDRTLGSSSSNKRKYHKVVVENHLEMEVNGKAGQMWELVLFQFSIISTVMFFPFPATLDSVLYICGKLFYIEAMATYSGQFRPVSICNVHNNVHLQYPHNVIQ